MVSKRNRTDDRSDSWRDKIHELEFTEAETEAIKVLVASDAREISAVIQDLCVDNAAIKIKSVEYYDCYTVSYTFDRHHPRLPGHTFWFYVNEPERGLRAMAAFVAEIMPDMDFRDITKRGKGLNL